MNICFVSREFVGSKRAGGIATYIYDISKALIADGHKVIVICASDNIFKSERILFENIDLIKLSGADYFLNSNRYIQFIGSKVRGALYFDSYRKKISKTLINLNNEIGLDIVEFPEFGNEAKFWLKEKNKLVPTIVRFHGIAKITKERTYIDLENIKIKSLLKTAFNADGVSFPSLAMIDLLTESSYSKGLYAGYKLPKRIIPNLMFLENQMLKNTQKDNYIFAAGSFCQAKGFQELIETVKNINNKGANINLLIAGKLGQLGIYYKNKSKNDVTYKGWLKILGPVKRDELFSYYLNAELCCFPSYWESFGLTCIESMSVGGLVLGSSSGGMSEIITNGEDGFLVAPKNKKLLQNKILEILSLDERGKDVIRFSAKNKILNKFSEKQVVGEMVSFYNEVINKFRSDANK